MSQFSTLASTQHVLSTMIIIISMCSRFKWCHKNIDNLKINVCSRVSSDIILDYLLTLAAGNYRPTNWSWPSLSEHIKFVSHVWYYPLKFRKSHDTQDIRYILSCTCIEAKILPYIVHYHTIDGGARGVVVIAVGNEHGHTSSNPGRDWLHFT